MSVIAARVEEGCITIASDSILIKDDLKRTNFKKLVEFDNMVVGGCGSAEELSLFFQYAKTHAAPESATTEGILFYLKKFAEWKANINSVDTIDNCYLIVYGNKLFEVDGMFVQEITEYTAIGEGESYALAALYLGHDVIAAVECACEFCSATSEPIISYTICKHTSLEDFL